MFKRCWVFTCGFYNIFICGFRNLHLGFPRWIVISIYFHLWVWDLHLESPRWIIISRFSFVGFEIYTLGFPGELSFQDFHLWVSKFTPWVSQVNYHFKIFICGFRNLHHEVPGWRYFDLWVCDYNPRAAKTGYVFKSVQILEIFFKIS